MTPEHFEKAKEQALRRLDRTETFDDNYDRYRSYVEAIRREEERRKQEMEEPIEYKVVPPPEPPTPEDEGFEDGEFRLHPEDLDDRITDPDEPDPEVVGPDDDPKLGPGGRPFFREFAGDTPETSRI